MWVYCDLALDPTKCVCGPLRKVHLISKCSIRMSVNNMWNWLRFVWNIFAMTMYQIRQSIKRNQPDSAIMFVLISPDWQTKLNDLPAWHSEVSPLKIHITWTNYANHLYISFLRCWLSCLYCYVKPTFSLPFGQNLIDVVLVLNEISLFQINGLMSSRRPFKYKC